MIYNFIKIFIRSSKMLPVINVNNFIGYRRSLTKARKSEISRTEQNRTELYYTQVTKSTYEYTVKNKIYNNSTQ